MRVPDEYIANLVPMGIKFSSNSTVCTVGSKRQLFTKHSYVHMYVCMYTCTYVRNIFTDSKSLTTYM